MITAGKRTRNLAVKGPVPLMPEVERLTELGCCVVPLKPGEKAVAIPTWKQYQRERPTAELVRGWFDGTDSQQLGVGVILGSVSGGVIVRDFDKAGAYDAWRERHKALAAELPTVLTGRGHHVYARCEGAQDVRCRKFSDGELRANGGYVVAPPSWHGRTGRHYTWLIPPQKTIPLVPIEALLGNNANKPMTHSSYLLCVTGSAASLQELVLGTLPNAPGQRNQRILKLVQALKPRLESVEAAEPWVKRWHEAALPVITTKEWEATWRDFRAAWRLYRGGSAVLEAASVAAASPLPAVAMRYTDARQRWLIGICRELQRRRGAEYIFLSCRDAGRAIGAEFKTANRWLGQFCADGVLELVERGTPGNGATGKASRFFYKGD